MQIWNALDVKNQSLENISFFSRASGFDSLDRHLFLINAGLAVTYHQELTFQRINPTKSYQQVNR